ncbi:MAG: hypothetical protein M3P82_06540 [Bacteroidota bacterium]|nr:hypothetical protein [Bacteroidota bacterium]
MLRSIIFFLFFSFTIAGCSNDNPVAPPLTGPVLLAEIPGDSVGIQSGSSAKTIGITPGLLNFTDRDSALISFYYSGENNSSTEPFQIFFNAGPGETYIYNSSNLNILPAEQFVSIPIPSPHNSQFYSYRIKTISSGFSFFKFRDLKIYKK